METTIRAVGSSVPRADARAKILGTAAYPGDIDLPDQAWVQIVFAGIPHARIRHIETSAARAMPGVITILTAQDVPVNEYGLVTPDQPVFCGTGGTLLAETVRWEADHVAAVVAETEAQAKAAARQVQIDYEPLPVVTSPEEALEADAPQIHPNAPGNVLHGYKLRRGDVAAAFEACDVVVESTYRTHAQEHAYLQPEAGLAFIRPDGRLEVIVAGQWMHEDRQQIAHALGMAEEEIVVRYPAIGGAFGGREDMSVQIVLGLAALKTGRPVKTVWSREESIVGHHKRHPFTIHAKWGATKDGKILAAQADVISDAGGYNYTSTKVLGNATMMCLGPYEIPNVQVDARTVCTNNCPSGAFRGFGAPQGHFAAEMQVTKLAAALGMDPVEFRWRNVLRDGSILPSRSVVPPGCTASHVLEGAAERAGWQQSHAGWHKEKTLTTDKHNAPSTSGMIRPSLFATNEATANGMGVAVCFKNVGYSLGFPEHCHAWVELHGGAEVERAVVGCVGAEVGQGSHVAFRQIAAEVLGLDTALVELRAEHTDAAGSSGSASASRLTFMAGNAIKGAAEAAMAAWENEERPARAEFLYRPRPTTMYDAETGESDPNITFGYCAQVADVAVDPATGHITICRLVSANDVGRAVNPQLIEGQIEGAVAQSVGWALLENYIQKDGRTLTPYLSNYLIPGVLDVAEIIDPVILEIPDPQGPLGARGMAEMPMIPTAPAIAAAIHDATGVWIDELPITPERMWKSLRKMAPGVETPV